MNTKNYLMKGLFIILFGITIIGCVNKSKEPTAINGKQIFETNCKGCHSIGTGQTFGPSLLGVTNKREKEWLIKFIRSSHTLIKKGDEQAKVLYDDFGNKRMPDHKHLTDKQIEAILAYIEKNSPSIEEIMDTIPLE